MFAGIYTGPLLDATREPVKGKDCTWESHGTCSCKKCFTLKRALPQRHGTAARNGFTGLVGEEPKL